MKKPSEQFTQIKTQIIIEDRTIPVTISIERGQTIGNNPFYQEMFCRFEAYIKEERFVFDGRFFKTYRRNRKMVRPHRIFEYSADVNWTWQSPERSGTASSFTSAWQEAKRSI